MKEYPRPLNDSGIGFHYFPDADHFGRSDQDLWLPRLHALGTSWLVMQTPPTRPVPDAFLQRVMLADIEPVVVIKPARIGPFDPTIFAETVRSLADSGVHYVVLFDRANDPLEVNNSFADPEYADQIKLLTGYLEEFKGQTSAAGMQELVMNANNN